MTPRRIAVCLLIGVLAAIPAIFVNTVIGYLPVLTYVISLLLCFLYVRVLKNQLAFANDAVSGECTRGETMGFSATVANASLLPAVRIEAQFFLSDLFGEGGSVEAHYLTLPPRAEKTFDFKVRFDHIGTYTVGIARMRVNDPLGIFAAEQENARMTQVKVLPRIWPIERLPLSKDTAQEAKKHFSTTINDGLDYSSVREYEQGDPIKFIHWKLSSRLADEDYLTRLYETNANPAMAVVLDFSVGDYVADILADIYDMLVECAFSLENYANVNSFDAEFLFIGASGRCMRYTAPFGATRREMLERMPQIRTGGTGKEILSLLRDEMSSPFARSNLVVCSAMVTTRLAEALSAARAHTQSCNLFAIVPDRAVTADEENGATYRLLGSVLRRLASSGVDYRLINTPEALSGTAKAKS